MQNSICDQLYSQAKLACMVMGHKSSEIYTGTKIVFLVNNLQTLRKTYLKMLRIKIKKVYKHLIRSINFIYPNMVNFLKLSNFGCSFKSMDFLNNGTKRSQSQIQKSNNLQCRDQCAQLVVRTCVFFCALHAHVRKRASKKV